jgi:hypothetical protein
MGPAQIRPRQCFSGTPRVLLGRGMDCGTTPGRRPRTDLPWAELWLPLQGGRHCWTSQTVAPGEKVERTEARVESRKRRSALGCQPFPIREHPPHPRRVFGAGRPASAFYSALRSLIGFQPRSVGAAPTLQITIPSPIREHPPNPRPSAFYSALCIPKSRLALGSPLSALRFPYFPYRSAARSMLGAALARSSGVITG